MTPPTGVRHLPDEDLLVYLDGEADEALSEIVRVHVAGCAACARRTERLRRRSAALDARIAELLPPPELLARTHARAARTRMTRLTVRPQHDYMRAAAIVAVVLLTGAVLASPLRARALDWAAARWRYAVALLGGHPEPQASVEVASDTAGLAGPTEYRFIPEGDELRLELASRQRDGTMTVVASTGDAVVLQVLGGSGKGDPVLFLPDLVRIGNGSGSTASFRLSVPDSLGVLRVRVGGGSWTTLRPSEFWPGEQRVLPLHRARGR